MSNINVLLQLKQYFVDSNFPEWTKSSIGITTPLTLPETKSITEDESTGGFGCERDAECLIPKCNTRYIVPKQEPEYLRHLLQDHQIVIGTVFINTWEHIYVKHLKCCPTRDAH